MQALQALFLSPFSQAELFTYHTTPVYRGYTRFRWLIQEEPEQSTTQTPSPYVITVQAITYPDKTTGKGWGDPVYAEPHRRKSFADSASLRSFLDEQGLPHSWEPVEREGNEQAAEQASKKGVENEVTPTV